MAKFVRSDITAGHGFGGIIEGMCAGLITKSMNHEIKLQGQQTLESMMLGTRDHIFLHNMFKDAIVRTARTCLTYLSSEHLILDVAQMRADDRFRAGRQPKITSTTFSEYAIRFWPDHYRYGENYDPSLTGQLQHWIQDCLEKYTLLQNGFSIFTEAYLDGIAKSPLSLCALNQIISITTT